MVCGLRCNLSASIKYGSWFHHSNLTLHEIMLITYDIVHRERALRTRSEHRLSAHTVADWGMFCRETELLFLERSFVKIGGPNKTDETEESKFGRRKYHRGHPVKGQFVFGGDEREPGETFLVPVPDRSADKLTTIICAWIEPGTMVISESWAAYSHLNSQGYKPHTAHRSIQIVNPENGAYINKIETTWQKVKDSLRIYNRGEDY